jgi:hypothetical protein
MQCTLTANIDDAQAVDLPAMLATLGSYDRLFGPRHIQTLSLTARIAEVLRGLGDRRTARALLERVVRDFGQSAGRTHSARISALRELKDLLLEMQDIRAAIAVQTELSECRAIGSGPNAPETLAAKADLGTLLLSAVEGRLEI